MPIENNATNGNVVIRKRQKTKDIFCVGQQADVDTEKKQGTEFRPIYSTFTQHCA